MARSKLPQYSLHKPSGRAVVKVNGRSIYLGKHNSQQSREAYARIIADLIAGREIRKPCRVGGGSSTLVSRITVKELAAKFVEHAEGYYVKGGKPTSELAAIRCAVRFLQPYDPLAAEEFSIGDLKAVRTAMVEAGHSRNSINKNIRRIRLAFRWGATEELISPTIAQALALLPGLKQGRSAAKETKPVEPVPEDAVIATLKRAPTIVGNMVRLQLRTGMRPDEVCMIRPLDVDRSSDVWVYTPRQHKTEHHGRQRTVFIGPEGQKILRPYLLRAEDEFCFQPKRFSSIPKSRRRYRVDSYRQAIERACDRAFPAPDGTSGEDLRAWRKRHRWTPNRLRHTAATEIRKRFGLEASQVILGHSKADVTQIYAQADSEMGIEIMRLIG